MPNVIKALCFFTLTLILFACSSHLTPSPKLAELHHKDFAKALRWKQFKVAASHMDADLRKPFLETFNAVKEIDIIDVRLSDIELSEDNRRFEASFEMDYILLPSVTLKTFKFDQTWEFRQDANPPYGGYVVVTPFPDFP